MSSNDRLPQREPAPGADGPRDTRRILYGLGALCVLLLLVDPLIDKHPYFEVEHWWGFYGLAGFVGIIVAVLVAVALRQVVVRREDYYDQ